MSTALPPTPHLDPLRKQARQLLRAYRSADPAALRRIRAYMPHLRQVSDAALLQQGVTLQSAQCIVAREYGFANWAALTRAVQIIRQAGRAMLREADDALTRGQPVHFLVQRHVAGEVGQRLADHCGHGRVLLLQESTRQLGDVLLLVADLAQVPVVVTDPGRLGFAVMYERLQAPDGPRPLAELLAGVHAFVNVPLLDESTPLVISGPDGKSGGSRELIAMHLTELYGLYASMADHRF